MKNHTRCAAVVVCLLVCLLLALSQSTNQAKLPYQDPSLPTEKRVADLISRMTLEEKVSQMMNGAAPIERLGIPAYDWWNEALHGVARAGYATVFPQAIGMAATWNEDLVHQIGDVASTEARAKNNESVRNGDRGRYEGMKPCARRGKLMQLLWCWASLRCSKAKR